MREVILDTETTGLSFSNGDRIIEVGCVELFNHVASGKTLQFYCNVDREITKEAAKVHGITNEFLKTHKTFKEQAGDFLDFIKNDVLVIHNAEFDLGFINNELRLIGAPKLNNKVIDTLALARKKLKTRIANLDYLCRRFSIDLSERKLHGALLDSHLLAEVYLELNGGKQISMNLDTSEKNKHKNQHFVNKINKSDLNFAKITLSENEKQDHKNLVNQIKNPLWKKIYYKN